MPPSYCDLAHISDPGHKAILQEDLPDIVTDATIPVLALELEAKPFSKGHLLEPGVYRLSLKLAASNYAPHDCVVEVDFKGKWIQDEEKMLSDGVGIRLL
jgi:hypothetical protein